MINPQKFGSQPYSHKELVAEMGASFLCSTVQIDYGGITDYSASLILAGWLNVLKADSRFIFKAAAEAQKAEQNTNPLKWYNTSAEVFFLVQIKLVNPENPIKIFRIKILEILG